jgi:hypothetical protein
LAWSDPNGTDDLQTRDAETSIELNFAVLKFKHTVKKQRGKNEKT